MKVFYSSLVAAMLLASAGGAVAQEQSSEMNQAKIGSANTEPGSTKAEGGTAAGSQSGTSTQGAANAPRADQELPSGPDKDVSTQTGSANTKPGDTKVQGGTAAGSSSGSAQGTSQGPRADEELPSGPDKDMSTQTGSANTKPGDTKVQGGTASGN